MANDFRIYRQTNSRCRDDCWNIKSEDNAKEAYAICLKEEDKAIGAIELKLNGHTDMTDRKDECELGYWLGKPFWGQGIMPEAVKEMLRHAFEDCGMQKVWCGYYEGNAKSMCVQEKCSFKYQRKSENVDVPLMEAVRSGGDLENLGGDGKYSKTIVCPDGCVIFKLTAKPLGNENYHKGGFWDYPDSTEQENK